MLNKIKNIIHNPVVINIISILLFFFGIYFISKNCHYAIIANDDMEELLGAHIKFAHSCYIYVLFDYFFIKVIPDLLNIPVQNFAFIPEGLVKSVLYTILIFSICIGINEKKKNNFNNILVILSYFFILSVFFREHNFYSFDTLIFFNSYISPLIFLFLCIYKIINFYLKKEKLTFKNVILIIVYSLLICMGNEMIMFVLFSVLCFILLEYIIKKLCFKENNQYIHLLLPLGIILLFIVVLFKEGDTTEIYNVYGSSVYFPTLHQWLLLAKFTIKKLFLTNLYTIIPLFIYMLILKKLTDDKTKKIIIINIYFYISLLLFFVLTCFMHWTCHYIYVPGIQTWLLCPMFQTMYAICLYFSAVLLTKHVLFHNEITKSKKIISISIFILASLFCIYKNIKPINFIFYNYESRCLLYKMDKISVYNIKNNKNISECREKRELYPILAFYAGDFEYVKYLENVYNVKGNVQTEDIPFDQYYNDYINNGGIFTEEELKKLDFKEINK